MGYAFINFISPLDIVTFAQARVGTTWNVFASEKICAVSYANIQGKAALVEKFRNSCVMDEQEAYRPHIYHSRGSLVGEAELFPGPNNLSRKARSAQTAQQVGLFPPLTSEGRVQNQLRDNVTLSSVFGHCSQIKTSKREVQNYSGVPLSES